MTCLAAKTTDRFVFGPFELIPARQRLLKDGVPVRIGRRAFDILTVLVQHQGIVVSKRQVMSRAWPGMAVDDSNLKVNIAALRRTLGEDLARPLYIATVVGRGYRFIAPVYASRLGAAGSMSATPPQRPHNLPERAAPIFGRSLALTGILQDLQSARLVSIVGAGGIGKTTVALAAAQEAAARFEAGAWFVDLAALNGASSLTAAIALAIGINVRPGHPDPALLERLADRKMLLVLDNCEHVIEAAATCADQILSSVKHVKLLVTSREPLRIKGERVRRLCGLSIPPASGPIRAADALEFAAVELFAGCARARNPRFKLNDATAPVVAEICRRMDGLPLGIELIAMRANTMDAGKMLEHIDKRFHMLDGYHSGPERHRTLTAAIDWSYRLLSPPEQAALRCLATFAGDFSLESACAVAADDGADPTSVVEDVASLAEKSLLTATAQGGDMSYRLSHIARAFGLELLAAAGELDCARRRHAQHVLLLAERAAADAAQLPGAASFARYGAILEDIRTAMDWALSVDAGATLAVRLVVAAIPVWKQQGLEAECRAAVTRALQDRFRVYRSASDTDLLRRTMGAA